MKRSRQYTRRQDREDEDSILGQSKAPPEPERTWAECMQGQPDEAFIAYAMTAKFEKGSLIAHPTFGRGAILTVDGRRIEVLFEDAKRKLVHAG